MENAEHMVHTRAENDPDEHYRLTLKAVIDAGEILLRSGGEANRVEDTIIRLCTAFGFIKTDVFTITSNILVTAIRPDGVPVTQTRRVRGTATDLRKVEAVNALSRRICSEGGTVEEMEADLEKIRKSPGVPMRTQYLMYAVISAAFALFFGGTSNDAVISALTGILLLILTKFSEILELYGIVQKILLSAAIALAAMLLLRAGLPISPDKVIMGNIMLLVPGIQLTTSLRDMITGDLVTGMLNLSEAVLKAVALAAGCAFVVGRMGG